MKTKIVYKDENITKVIFGELMSEDDIFFNIRADDGTNFRINKRDTVTLKELEARDYEDRANY